MKAIELSGGSLLAGLRKDKVGVLGPAPAPIVKVKDNYRWHLIVKADSFKNLHTILTSIENENRNSKKVQMMIDVDPYMLL